MTIAYLMEKSRLLEELVAFYNEASYLFLRQVYISNNFRGEYNGKKIGIL